MDSEPKKKKWVSKRLNDKMKELGIPQQEKNIIKEEMNNSDGFITKKSSKKVDKEKSYKKNDFSSNNDYRKSNNSSDRRNNFTDRRNNSYDKRNGKKFVIQISNLPKDINIKELNDLIEPWGDIGNINIKHYSETVCSYIDFYNSDEASYFVDALNSTPFDNLIINVKLMDFSNQSKK